MKDAEKSILRKIHRSFQPEANSKLRQSRQTSLVQIVVFGILLVINLQLPYLKLSNKFYNNFLWNFQFIEYTYLAQFITLY